MAARWLEQHPTEEQVARAELWSADMIGLNYEIRQFPAIKEILDTTGRHRILFTDNQFISTLIPERGLKIAYVDEHHFANRAFETFDLNEGGEYLLPMTGRTGTRYQFRYTQLNVANPALVHIIARKNLAAIDVIPMRPGRDVVLLPYRKPRVVAMIPPDQQAAEFIALCENDEVPRAEVEIGVSVKHAVLKMQVGVRIDIMIQTGARNDISIRVQHDPELDGTDQLHKLEVPTVPSQTTITVIFDIEDAKNVAKYWAEDFTSIGYAISEFPELEENLGSSEPTKMGTAQHHFYSLTVPANGLRLFGSARSDATASVKEVGPAYITGGRYYMLAIKFDERITVFYKTPPKNRAVLFVVAYKRWDWKDKDYDQTQHAISERIPMRVDRDVVYLCVPSRLTKFAMLPAKNDADEGDNVTSDLPGYSKYGQLNNNFQISQISLAIRSILAVTATRARSSDGMPWIRFRPLERYNGLSNIPIDDSVLVEPESPDIVDLSEDKDEHKMGKNPDEPPEKKQKTEEEKVMDIDQDVPAKGSDDNEFGDDGWSL